MATVELANDDADLMFIANIMQVLDIGDRGRLERPFRQSADVMRINVSGVNAEAADFGDVCHR